MVCFVRAYHFFLGSYRLYGLHAALYYGYFIRLLYGFRCPNNFLNFCGPALHRAR